MTAELNSGNLDITSQITLEYLTSPYYHNIIASRKKTALNEINGINNNNTIASLEDISFYRKRIVAMTKDMLKGNNNIPSPNADMKTHYNNYIRSMIDYFKMLDRKDIIQDEYKNLTAENENSSSDVSEAQMTDLDISTIKLEKADELIMKKTIKIANLDDFVTITTNAADNEKQIMPVKKEIDLKLATLKTKGIKKKTTKKDK
jgi:hypothetical protein